uniref:Uncharacterized protein n=1 Tax=viral metagenome TaxID=1070528 RepID=A0A6M3LPB5_9ZZZZ
MLFKEIKQEAVYVLILWIIITWGIVACDIQYRMSDQYFCDTWEYNLSPQEGTGFSDSIVKPN